MNPGEHHLSARTLAPLALAGLLALTGCGGDGADGAETAAAGTTAAPAPSAPASSSEPSAEPSTGPSSGAAATGTASAPAAPGTPPDEPTGTVPEGWEVVEPGGATTFALPADATEQDLPDTGIEGLDISLYAVPDGSLLALYQSFPEDVAASVAPEELLAQASAGALGAATFAEGTQREEPFRLGDHAGTEIGGFDQASDTWLSGRLLVVDDVLLGFVATAPDETDADEALDEAWDGLSLP